MNIIENSMEFCINFLAIIRKIATKLHLTPSQILCIYAIPFSGISQSDLAKKLSIDISTLSRNLEKLITLNIITKQSSLLDRRSYKISLTTKGVELYDIFNLTIKNKLNSTYNKLELDEYDQFEEILN